MWTFLGAGILYLVGIAIILFLKPKLMFTPDGQWKEFGIGQNPEKYSPFPFWMFCLVWALLSYLLVLLLTPHVGSKKEINSSRRINNQATLPLEEELDFDGQETVELPKGYYVLNKRASKLAGVPKYVYLGPQEP